MLLNCVGTSCLADIQKQPSISATPAIAIIIDDIGDNLASGLNALALPGDITYAFLPHTPYAKQLAEQAHDRGKEVMLHLPMSSMTSFTLGPGALTSELDQQQFNTLLVDNFRSVPHVVGTNNHMGSLLTQQPLHMRWLMTFLKERKLFFIDSRTTEHSIALTTAKNVGVAAIERDVFLDDEKEAAAIAKQFAHLILLAKTNRLALGIAHPYAVSINYLQSNLPKLASLGVQLVKASELIKKNRALINLEKPVVPY